MVKMVAAKTVPCLLCGKLFEELPIGHLKNKHGMTRDQYLMTFALKETDIVPGKPPESVYTNSLSLFATEKGRLENLTTKVADELDKNGELARRITPEVERLVLAKYKSGLAAACMSLIQTRLTAHGKAVALLEEARSRLSEKWRLDQGGDGGGPTPIPHLVSMVHSALAEVKTGEELILKTLKLMIDEQKGADDRPNPFTQLDATAYKSTPIPENLDPRQRENMRRLMMIWGKAFQGAVAPEPKTIEVTVLPVPEEPVSSPLAPKASVVDRVGDAAEF
jgi:predicted transcriptional regulator